MAATAAVASAQYCTPDQCDECDLNNCHLSCCYDPPELWLVNTRCVPKCNNLDEGFERISIKRWDRDVPPLGRRDAASRSSPKRRRCRRSIFAHGNTLKHKGAMKQCWYVYQQDAVLPRARSGWCSGRGRRRSPSSGRCITPRKLIMKNLRIKFVYAEYQGYYMAKLVQRMSMTQRVTVGGHSYGAISAAVAAHFLGGGELRGLTLAGADRSSGPTSASPSSPAPSTTTR